MWGWVTAAVLALVGGLYVWWSTGASRADTFEALSKSQAAKIESLEAALKTKWAEEKKNDAKEAADVTDVSGALDFLRKSYASSGVHPNPGLYRASLAHQYYYGLRR